MIRSVLRVLLRWLLPLKISIMLRTEWPFSETSAERADGEVERGFRKRPLRAVRLAEVHGCLVCAVFECPQKSRAV